MAYPPFTPRTIVHRLGRDMDHDLFFGVVRHLLAVTQRLGWNRTSHSVGVNRQSPLLSRRERTSGPSVSCGRGRHSAEERTMTIACYFRAQNPSAFDTCDHSERRKHTAVHGLAAGRILLFERWEQLIIVWNNCPTSSEFLGEVCTDLLSSHSTPNPPRSAGLDPLAIAEANPTCSTISLRRS